MNANTVCSWGPLLLLLLLAASQQHLAKFMKPKECDYQVDLFRLPRRVQPVNYKLEFFLDPKEGYTSANVEIDLNISDEMDSEEFLLSRTVGSELPRLARDPRNIILNADGLKFRDVIFVQDESSTRVESICADSRHKILVVTLNEKPSSKQAAKLIFSSMAKVKTEAKGLFKSSFEFNKWTIATNFEPANARLLFPCFDEPEFKATFEVTIVHPQGTTALSNMPIEEVQPQVDPPMTQFKITPKMSTYLLSLAVVEFERIEEISKKDGTKIAIYAPRDWAGRALEMLDKAVQTHDQVNDFFADLPRSLKKMDIVALNTGPVMKGNWGLATMRLDFLSARSGPRRPKAWIGIVTTVMREMIHQRLANSLTIRWWDDLWLKEGLAIYLAGELTAEWYNKLSGEQAAELRTETSGELCTLAETAVSAMNDEDDPAMAHPVKDKELRTAEEIEAWYDLYTHTKSAAVLRMFAHFFGKDNLKSTIRELSTLLADGLVSADDWWQRLSGNTLQHRVGLEMAKQWTEQKGYPTIIVGLQDESTVLVKQEPKLSNYRTWLVPIKYELYAGPENGLCDVAEFVLSDSETFSISLPKHCNIEDEYTWLTLNANFQGYYRVVYTTETLMGALSRAVKSNRMPPVYRWQLISDAYTHAKQTRSTEMVRRLIHSFSGETDDGVKLLLDRLKSELRKPSPRKRVLDPMFRYPGRNRGVSGGHART